MTTQADFTVEGVDLEDGGRTTLYDTDSSSEAVAWMRRYVASEDAGGWSLIEVYDTRPEPPERVAFWERDAD